MRFVYLLVQQDRYGADVCNLGAYGSVKRVEEVLRYYNGRYVATTRNDEVRRFEICDGDTYYGQGWYSVRKMAVR